MLILRNKKDLDLSSTTQALSNTLEGTVSGAENALDYVDQSKIGKTSTVKKKTRMAKNMITGIKAYMIKKKPVSKKKDSKEESKIKLKN